MKELEELTITPARPVAVVRTELYEGLRDGRLDHNQTIWIRPRHPGALASEALKQCGTTACAAGWATLLSAPADATVHPSCISTEVGMEDADDFGRHALGLTDTAAYELFYNSSNARALAQLKYYAEHPEADSLPDEARDEIWAATSARLSA